MTDFTTTTKAKRGRPFEAAPKFAMPTDLLGYNIVRLAHLKKVRDEGLFRSQLGIGLSQFGALMMLRSTPGLGAGQLARWLLLTPQSVAAQLAELESLQLVEREAGGRRGARIKLHITKRGTTIIALGQTALEQAEAEVRRGLSKEEAQTLNRLLLQVAEAYTDLQRSARREDSSAAGARADAFDKPRTPRAVRAVTERGNRKSVSTAGGRGKVLD